MAHPGDNGIGYAGRIDHVESRLSILEASVAGVRDTVEHRIDELCQAIGHSPDPSLGRPGRGLCGAVATLLEAEADRRRAERERDARAAAWERRRGWISAIVGICAGVLTSAYYAGALRH